MLELTRQGTFNGLQLFMLFAMVCGVIAFIVFMERAHRRVVVQYPKRQMGNKMVGGEQTISR